MRTFLVLVALPCLLSAQYSFYACASNAKEYVVGAKLPPSGLFRHSAATRTDAWLHTGFNLPFLFSLDYDRADPTILYLAAGNGLIRASNRGAQWKILTGSDITEIRDVAVDPNTPGIIYFAYSHGIRVSQDRGATWTEIGATLHRRFTESIRVDRTNSGVVLAGGEEGVFRTVDNGAHWKLSGAAGFQIMKIEQSPHEPCLWLAATQGGGLFRSTDCGVTFESFGRIGVGHTLYDVAFDPLDPARIAVAGWDVGVAISDDRGLTWRTRNAGLPAPEVLSFAFDPVHRGRIYASVHEEALFVSGDYGLTWKRGGLEGSDVARMKFIPEPKSK